MTTEKDYTEIFGASLVASMVHDDVEFYIFSNRIFYVRVPQLKKVQMDLIEKGYAFLDENGGGAFYNIFEFESFSDVEPEVREWASASSGNKYTISDALVIDSLSQKIITDFYLKFNKPVKPTKVFYDFKKALSWTLERMKRDTN